MGMDDLKAVTGVGDAAVSSKEVGGYMYILDDNAYSSSDKIQNGILIYSIDNGKFLAPQKIFSQNVEVNWVDFNEEDVMVTHEFSMAKSIIKFMRCRLKYDTATIMIIRLDNGKPDFSFPLWQGW